MTDLGDRTHARASGVTPSRQRGGPVDRPRLRRVFDDFEQGIRVVGIWASAGSGKSTLLAQWMASADGDVCFADASGEEEVRGAIRRSRESTASRVYLVIDQLERASTRMMDA